MSKVSDLSIYRDCTRFKIWVNSERFQCLDHSKEDVPVASDMRRSCTARRPPASLLAAMPPKEVLLMWLEMATNLLLSSSGVSLLGM